MEGEASFSAGLNEHSELYQDVDVRAFESQIAVGQDFGFAGYVRTYDETPSDTVRVRVEYRDTSNTVILDAFDSGEITSPDEWLRIEDVRTAPASTGWIRVRLLSKRFQQARKTTATSTPWSSARGVRRRWRSTTWQSYEGTGELPTEATFTVSLACVWESTVSLSYATVDGTALSFEDYEPAAGTLTFLPGETAHTITVFAHRRRWRRAYGNLYGRGIERDVAGRDRGPGPDRR